MITRVRSPADDQCVHSGHKLSVLLLGPFETLVEGALLPIPRQRQRAILALLALRSTAIVSVDHIVDAVWGELAPRHVRNQIQVHVCGLRRMLAAAGLPRDTLTTSPTGYRLNHASCSRDVDVLDAMVAAARRAIGAADLERASVLLRSALALWRGPSLDCVSAAFVAAESVMLEERRLSVLCDLADVQFARGRSGDVIPHLTGYLHAHPLDEGIRLRLMRALSELGRRADALSVYRQGRDVMVAELGLEPGPALLLAEAAILRGDQVDISLTGRHVC